jgi:hypothetical protein
MPKVQRDDGSATPDQVRAQEKRDAALARATAAAESSRTQDGDELAEREAAPKGRRSAPQSEA